MDRPLMTSAELAEYLQVPLNTLRDWRYRGIGPTVIRVGRHVRYAHEDVASWLETQKDR